MSASEDARTVAALDTEFQAAMKHGDLDTIDRILLDDFVLVVGSGKAFSKADILEEARTTAFMQQIEEAGTQVVRVWGDTAVVTAKLWLKGTSNGQTFDRRLWFSDTYVRTAAGWRYAFGQSSLELP